MTTATTPSCQNRYLTLADKNNIPPKTKSSPQKLISVIGKARKFTWGISNIVEPNIKEEELV